MNVTILYFAAVRDLVGIDEEVVALPDGVSTIGTFAIHLAQVRPELDGRLPYVRFARNEEFALDVDMIAEGDVLALIPPVAGG